MGKTTKVARLRTVEGSGEQPLQRTHNLNIRGQKNRAINQQLAREKISNGKHIEEVCKCLLDLGRIEQNAKRVKKFDRNLQSKYMVRIGAIGKKMDGHLKLINKFLPDLKSSAIENEDGSNPIEEAAKTWAAALNRIPD